MDINYLKKIIKTFNESGINEIEIEEEGLKLRLKKSDTVHREYITSSPSIIPNQVSMPVQSLVEVKSPEPKTKEPDQKKTEPSKNLYEIKSPIVGTFYRSPSPDAEPYVKQGDKISVGTVLCIVEAMKLMNEIESDVSGVIVSVLVENGKPVEYGQPLFLIEKT